MINYQKTWATLDIDEKMAFRDMAIKAVQEIYPHYIVRPWEPTEADCFFVGNKQENVRVKVPLRDLFARFSLTAKTNDDLKQVIFEVYAGVLNQAEDVSVATEVPDFTWNDVREYARPQHFRLDHIPEGKINFQFGADVTTAIVFDRPQDAVHYWITQEMLDRWGKTVEELFKEAMENLSDLAEGIEIVGTMTPRKELWPEKGPEYASSCLLLPHMRKLLADTMDATKFRFGIPSRHRFYAWVDIDDEKFQIEQRAKMEREMDRYPSPLTADIYEVDEKGNITRVKPQPLVPPVPMISNN